MNILLYTKDFDQVSGVSTYLFSLIELILQHHEHKIYVASNGGNALNRLSVYGIDHLMLPVPRTVLDIRLLPSTVFALRRFCQQKNITIIHTHHRWPELIAAIARVGLDIGLVSTGHSFVRGRKIFSYRSDRIIAVSKAVQNHLMNYYRIPADKIDQIYNCLPKTHHDLRGSRKKTAQRFVRGHHAIHILFAGRISRIKGVDILLKAYSELKKTFPTIILTLVGYVSEDMVQEMNHLPDGVLFEGPSSSMDREYEKADIIVLPSREDPFPFVMLEAGIMKKPLVGSRVGGIAEFIHHRKEGLLFDSGDVAGLIRQITYMISHPEQAARMGKNLYKKVIENCSCDAYYEKMMDVYDDALRYRALRRS
jgi:glycosyltransferase involved in cell wall biosynthesis